MQSGNTHRDNNFDFIRLIAACFVLYSHQFAMAARPEPGFGSYLSLGGLGVAMFFSISGYLVARSWQRDPVIVDFLAKRVLRIWPGLIVVVLMMAFVLGPAVTTLPVGTYFHSAEVWRFVVKNLLLFTAHENLPGVFHGNPYPDAVNGSLWTLPEEFRCYLLLMVVGFLGISRRPGLMLAGVAVCALIVFFHVDTQHRPHLNYALEYKVFFFYGAVLCFCREIWAGRKAKVLTVSLIACLSVVACLAKYELFAFCLFLPPLVIWAGSASTPYVRRAGRFGDFSYGIYIYAFPVQQTVVFLSKGNLSFGEGLAMTAVITFALAFLSWHLVEKPSLNAKRYFSPLKGRRSAAVGQSP